MHFLNPYKHNHKHTCSSKKYTTPLLIFISILLSTKWTELYPLAQHSIIVKTVLFYWCVSETTHLCEDSSGATTYHPQCGIIFPPPWSGMVHSSMLHCLLCQSSIISLSAWFKKACGSIMRHHQIHNNS